MTKDNSYVVDELYTFWHEEYRSDNWNTQTEHTQRIQNYIQENCGNSAKTAVLTNLYLFA